MELKFVISDTFIKNIKDEVLIDKLGDILFKKDFEFIPRIGETIFSKELSRTLRVHSMNFKIEDVRYDIDEGENDTIIYIFPCEVDGKPITEQDLIEYK